MEPEAEKNIARVYLGHRENGFSIGASVRRSIRRYMIMPLVFVVLLILYSSVEEPRLKGWLVFALGLALGGFVRDFGWLLRIKQTWPFTEKVTDWQKVERMAGRNGGGTGRMREGFILIGILVAVIVVLSLRKKPQSKPPAESAPTPDVQLPYETVLVAGKDAVAECMKLREEGRGRFTPVIMGAPERLTILAEGIELSTTTPEDTLKASQDIDAAAFIHERASQDEEYFSGVEIGEWVDNTSPANSLTGHTDILAGKPLDRVLICKVPTPNSWEVPAYLHYGGWNECPAAEEHVAMLKHWNEKYGAEIITMLGDVLEFTVSRPPSTKDEAMVLAKEQFVYCPDIVYQGVENLSNLAATMKDGGTWYFWWD